MNDTKQEQDNVTATPVPVQSTYLRKVIDPLYRFFDWVYSSEYNPLYRSGTLAVGFLLLLLVTGLYLSFFYSVSKPYESLIDINNQIWFGRWIRALHRYATVATLIAIFFHIIQLLAQGKCWGPRTLAWVSGIMLTGLFFVSVWTGYVMVWDQHAQKVVLAGARMLTVIPVLKEVVTAAFDGSNEIPVGFFFMNLFMHVALPLGMIIFLWIHTARLSRAVWFPRKKIMVLSSLGLLVFSILIPAPLLGKADFLKLVGNIPTDMVTGFWISWIERLGVTATWIILSLITLFLLSIPWLWKLKPEQVREISKVDPLNCTGCMQCTKDCPYEAIKMVPRPDGKRLIAEIIPQHCVSCGICAASCADFAIGPAGRTALDQQQRVTEFCESLKNNRQQIVMIACANNPGLNQLLYDFSQSQGGIILYPVECCGCVHSEVLEKILEVSEGCALIGCPARNCFNRDGGDLLSQRIFEKRVPFLDRKIDRKRLLIAPFSEAEKDKVLSALNSFKTDLAKLTAMTRTKKDRWLAIRSTVMSVALLSACSLAAQFPSGQDSQKALIRVAGTLPSSSAEKCRTPSEKELSDIPKHMRLKQICERTPITYSVSIKVNGVQASQRLLGENNTRLDKPLFLDLENEIDTGFKKVEISIQSSADINTECSIETDLKAGKIYLAHYRRQDSILHCGS